ncbi:conserved hypothetical protein, membrane [Candidatus Magnetomorum sp. HK-1]|nr:conserved hypothetical protein, membrane [Candidatus Magnetomorum sp. HK-1]
MVMFISSIVLKRNMTGLIISCCLTVFTLNFFFGVFPGFCDDHLPFEILKMSNLTIAYAPSLQKDISKIVNAYTHSEDHLRNIFHWNFTKKINLIVMNNRKDFLQIAEHPLTVAFAEGRRNRIIIDYPKITQHPFRLESTLQHELCHILMAQHLKIQIPRWLNEGIAQWVSEGIAEIIHPEKNLLQRAAFSGKLIPFYKLERSFPMDTNSFILAYEQSKSFVIYLMNTYGKNSFLKMLNKLKNGQSFHYSARFIYGKSWLELEREWIASETHYMAWFVFISNNMYTFIFIVLALISVFGFIRIKLKKHDYPEDWDDDDDDDDKYDNDKYDNYDDDVLKEETPRIKVFPILKLKQ